MTSSTVLAEMGVSPTSAQCAASHAQATPEATCDHACLSQVMASFLKAMTTGLYNSVPLSVSAELRANGKRTTLGDTAWKQVKTIKSEGLSLIR